MVGSPEQLSPALRLGQPQPTAPCLCHVAGCFVLLNTGSEVVDSAHGLLSTVGYKLGPQADTNYALEGESAGAADAGTCGLPFPLV